MTGMPGPHASADHKPSLNHNPNATTAVCCCYCCCCAAAAEVNLVRAVAATAVVPLLRLVE